jgi:Cu(I)/Ag(I) efflux system membrane fusion protein
MKMTHRSLVVGIAVAAAAVLGLAAVVAIRRLPHAVHETRATYYCPMHPTYTSDRPGDCPICNMKLVKREGRLTNVLVPVSESGETPGASAAAPAGYAPVLVSPQKQQFIGVTTAPATRRQLTKTIRTVGRIAYDPELYQAEQEYLQALTTLMKAAASDSRDVGTQAERLVEASRTRLRLLGLSDELINEMAAWPGPDRRLLGTDPSGAVWLYASIYEFELPLVRAGQTVEVEMATISGKRLSGVIRAIDPVLDPSTRAARVRAVLADPDRVLKPEMFVNALLAVPVGEVLAVPEAALIHTGAAHLVFVDKGQGLLEPREVVMGVTAEGYTEVRAGVAEGEPVVTSGNFLIDSESRLKAALAGAGEAGHQHGQ